MQCPVKARNAWRRQGAATWGAHQDMMVARVTSADSVLAPILLRRRLPPPFNPPDRARAGTASTCAKPRVACA